MNKVGYKFDLIKYPFCDYAFTFYFAIENTAWLIKNATKNQITVLPHIRPPDIIFIQRSRPKVTVQKCAGIIRKRVLFKRGHHFRKYSKRGLHSRI